jgi:hypothetical protein
MSESGTHSPQILLIGPYDPHCGEYTFLAPPLGVWRLAGVLEAAGAYTRVFDPNCCAEPPQRALERELLRGAWDVIGVSTTGMTLRFDLELAHLAHRLAPSALIVAGGMEATFRPELMFELGPFDRVVLGEGERPLLELLARLRARQPTGGISGTAERMLDGTILKFPQRALERTELRDAIFNTPYEKMPYAAYWERLENAYRVGALPSKAAREAHLAEIRSVRLITLNYCPMGCTFCSATNFLHEAQGSIAPIARLDTDEVMQMIERIVAAHPRVRTIIFQDDIFVFTKDRRILPLCAAIVAAKACGSIPTHLQFISTNRIDAMTEERLAAMRRAGFRVLGFGIENFSPRVLEDVAETLREAYRWLRRGCEIGMYPYVIPFSGAALAQDAGLAPYTMHATRRVTGTQIEWQQPAKILPVDATVSDVILRIERDFEDMLAVVQEQVAHLPSRLRSLVWILCSIPVLAEHGLRIADESEVRAELHARLPRTHGEAVSPAVAVA